MTIMETPGFFDEWLSRKAKFLDHLQSAFDEDGFPAHIQSLGCNFFIYVGTQEPVRNYQDFEKLDTALAKAFFRKCIEKGVYFHTDFTVSAMHDEGTLERAVEIIRSAGREAKAALQ